MKRTRLNRRSPLRNKSLVSRLRNGNLSPLEPGQLPEAKDALAKFIRGSAGKAKALGVRRPNLRSMVSELDGMARMLCKAMAKHRCERCGAGDGIVLDWHHIVTRRIYRLRWDMRNSLCLCKGCHFWWHNIAQLGAQWVWLERTFGPQRKQYLDMQLASVARGPKMDLAAVRVYLLNELSKYGG